jgi:hypothetical protein
MTEDKLLNELGDLARREEEAERAVLDERWDRLAAGTLSAEEDAELRALAETSPEAREAYEAFRPLGGDFQARVTEKITAELARGPAPEPVESAPEPEKPPARVLLFPRGAFRPLAWIGSAAAAAVLSFLFLRAPAAPLPVYTAALEGGVQAMRGTEPGPAGGLPVYYPNSSLTLRAFPVKSAQDPAAALEARAFFGRRGSGDLRPLGAKPEIESGAVRFRGRLGREIQIPPGLWRLWIVVGRRGEIPPADELAAALHAGRSRGDGWQAMSEDLRVDERAAP